MMPRIRKTSPSNPIHVTARAHNREIWPIDIRLAWSLFEDYLWFIRKNFNIRILNFVLMPNHFHLLLMSPDDNLGLAMAYFMRETAKQMNFMARTQNQIYGGPYYSSVMSSYHYFLNAYKYCYQNPCRANLSHSPLDWEYSTLGGLLGLRRMIIPLEEDTILFSPELDESAVRWLCRQSSHEDVESMRRGLKRKIFKLVADSKTQKRSRLEDQLL